MFVTKHCWLQPYIKIKSCLSIFFVYFLFFAYYNLKKNSFQLKSFIFVHIILLNSLYYYHFNLFKMWHISHGHTLRVSNINPSIFKSNQSFSLVIYNTAPGILFPSLPPKPKTFSTWWDSVANQTMNNTNYLLPIT